MSEPRFAKDVLGRRLALNDLVAIVDSATLFVCRIVENPKFVEPFAIGDYESSLPQSPFTLCEIYATVPQGREPAVVERRPLRRLVDLRRSIKVNNEPRS